MTDWRKQYKKAVTFSYDDGVEQDLRLLELFNRYGLKATFNVNTGIPCDSTWVYKDRLTVRRLNLKEHVKDYEGHEIAVHTLTHPDLTSCSEEVIEREVIGDRMNIADIFGNTPVGAAYPFGTYNEKVIKVLERSNIQYCRGVDSTYSFGEQKQLLAFQPTCHHDDERVFEIIDLFLKSESEETQILYIWGHSYEFDGNDNWNQIEEICKKVSGRKDIFYGTNREVLLPEYD